MIFHKKVTEKLSYWADLEVGEGRVLPGEPEPEVLVDVGGFVDPTLFLRETGMDVTYRKNLQWFGKMSSRR